MFHDSCYNAGNYTAISFILIGLSSTIMVNAIQTVCRGRKSHISKRHTWGIDQLKVYNFSKLSALSVCKLILKINFKVLTKNFITQIDCKVMNIEELKINGESFNFSVFIKYMLSSL